VAATIRLTRFGKKKRPFYRLIVMDSRKRRDGAYLANLGYYNPFVEPFEVKLHTDAILAWLQRGATVSDTARALLRSQGILHRFSLLRAGASPAEVEEAMQTWSQGADARTARRALQRQEARAADAAARKEAAKKAPEAAPAPAEGENTGDKAPDAATTGES
jgi:small subunit ribosomal protein S16